MIFLRKMLNRTDICNKVTIVNVKVTAIKIKGTQTKVVKIKTDEFQA